MSEPAGWYGNPDGTPTQRYWDGAQWTHNVRPIAGAPGVPIVEPTTQIDPTNQIDPILITPIQTDPSRVGPDPAPGPHEQEPTEAAEIEEKTASTSASISDLLGVLFDFGLDRPIGPALVRTIYRIGAIAVLVISAVLLAFGLRDGGLGAIIALVVYPLEALVWLILLRVVSQILLGRVAPQDAESE